MAMAIVGACLFGVTAATGQVTGRFYLDKQLYAPGEPVFLYFEAKNEGKESQNILQADPYSFCSGYVVHVSSDVNPKKSSCVTGLSGSCTSSSMLLKAGQSHVERFLLNYEHKLTADGEYEVEANRSWPYASAELNFFEAAHVTVETHAQLHFRIDSSASVDAPGLSKLVNQLHSTDEFKRREAGRTLATLAPKSLEDTLLAFVNDPQLRVWAPLAFHGLNTSRSMAAMAELLVKSRPGTYEHLESARYLGESHDSQWFPLLAEVARKNAQISNYVSAAAENGGDKAIRLLFELMQSPDKEFTRVNAVTAFGDTGSRAAVPILLDLLKSPDEEIADRARYGLKQLTHRSIEHDEDEEPESPQVQYPRWLRWWSEQGMTAHIYKANECSEIELLN